MTATPERSLAEQRASTRRLLQAQRKVVAGQLAPAIGGHGYPRSMAMRLLIQRPALLARLLALAAGAPVIASVSAILVLVYMYRITSERTALAAARSAGK